VASVQHRRTIALHLQSASPHVYNIRDSYFAQSALDHACAV